MVSAHRRSAVRFVGADSRKTIDPADERGNVTPTAQTQGDEAAVGRRASAPTTRYARSCRDERLTVSVGSHPVSRGVLVDGPTLLVSLLADAPNSEEPTVVRCAVRLFVLRVLL